MSLHVSLTGRQDFCAGAHQATYAPLSRTLCRLRSYAVARRGSINQGLVVLDHRHTVVHLHVLGVLQGLFLPGHPPLTPPVNLQPREQNSKILEFFCLGSPQRPGEGKLRFSSLES